MNFGLIRQMKKTKIATLAILTVTLLIGLFFRFYRLDQNIPSLYADETGHYLIFNKIVGSSANVGQWLYNKIFNGTFSLTWVFGLTPLGVRAASALYGSLATLSIFFFAYSISKNRLISAIAALLVAVIPWNFMISRISHTHVVILALLVVIHAGLFLRAKTISRYLICLLPLGLALIYYPSMVIIAPFAGILVLAEIYKLTKKKYRSILILGTILLVIGAAVLIGQRFNVLSTSGRGLDLAIWRDVNTPYDTDKFRALSWNSQPSLFSFYLPPEQLANKLFLNRISANLLVFTRNYLSFFSPDWLFLRGDAILRHSTGLVGAFYPFLLPFMLYGAFRFFKTADPKTRNLFLVWILVSPIPAAITKDGAGYLLRAVTMLPFLTYFCALGIVDSFGLISKKWRWPYGIVVALIGFYSAWSFFYGYFHVYPALSARAYEYGFKELSDFQVANDRKTMLVVWDGYYHNGDFRFWQRTPFDQYEAFKLKQIVIGESTFWQTFPNLYFSSPKSIEDYKIFINQYKPTYVILPDRYFVKYPIQIENLLDPIEQIKYPDQTPALTIYTPK